MLGLAPRVSLDIDVSFSELIRGKTPIQRLIHLALRHHLLKQTILIFTAIKMTALECYLATPVPDQLKRSIPVLIDVPVAATLTLDWKMVLSVIVQILFAPMLSKFRMVTARFLAAEIVSFSSPSVYICPLTSFGSRTDVWWSMAAQCIYHHSKPRTKPHFDFDFLDSLWMHCRRFSSGRLQRHSSTKPICHPSLCSNYKYAGVEYGWVI